MSTNPFNPFDISFTNISVLTGVVFPVWGLYRLFEAYSTVARRVALAHIRVGGVAVPIGALFSMEGALAADQQRLQGALIDIQKWFIYWVVYALWEAVEAALCLPLIIPLYDLWRWGLSVWLVLPMVLRLEGDDSGRSFDESAAWVAFTQLGAGWCYFHYLKPAIDKLSDKIKVDLPLIPLNIPDFVSLVSQASQANQASVAANLASASRGPTNSPPPQATSLALLAMEAVFDSLYVMVNQLRERFVKPNDEEPVETSTEPLLAETSKVSEANDSGTTESDTLLASSSHETASTAPATKKKKGWIW